MRQATRPITVDMPAAYYDTFIEMFKGMGIKYNTSSQEVKSKSKATDKPVSKAKPTRGTKEYVLDSIAEGVREAKLFEQGLIDLPTLEEVLDEL